MSKINGYMFYIRAVKSNRLYSDRFGPDKNPLRVISDMWRALTPDQKKIFEDRATEYNLSHPRIDYIGSYENDESDHSDESDDSYESDHSDESDD
jgi:hypothetical protein